jgi:hypothetical protein
MKGLWRVRRFRRFSQWLRYPLSMLVSPINSFLKVCRFRGTGDTKILVWSKESCYQPTVGHSITQLVNGAQYLPFQEVHNTAPCRRNAKANKADVQEHLSAVAEIC